MFLSFKSQDFQSITLLTFTDAAQATIASNRILEARKDQNKDAIADTEQIPNAEGGVEIELQNIDFKYATRDVPIFKGLNMHVSLSNSIFSVYIIYRYTDQS
jgi:ABC-type transport system involved in cytochrome bd biosynthesis fused ATPase/permease subunit